MLGSRLPVVSMAAAPSRCWQRSRSGRRPLRQRGRRRDNHHGRRATASIRYPRRSTACSAAAMAACRRRPGGHVRRNRSRGAQGQDHARRHRRSTAHRRRSADRLTDSIETYIARRGAAFAIVLGRDQGSGIGIKRRIRVRDREEGTPDHLSPIRIPTVSSSPSVSSAARRHRVRDAAAELFSFNNPFGACPTCHGFGTSSSSTWNW